MFRFTIRELVLLTLVVAMAVGWWVERQVGAEAAEDARMLAHFSANGSGCSQEAFWRLRLERKYGAERFNLTSIEAIEKPQGESHSTDVE